MNRSRRNELAHITSRIEDELRPLLHSLTEALAAIREEESDAHANLPESIQTGDRGEDMQAGIDALEEATALIEGLGGPGQRPARAHRDRHRRTLVSTRTPHHLAADRCYVCGHDEHPDTTPAGGHRFWSNATAAAHFTREAHKQQTTYTREAAYVAEHRPY